jgi:hypothetical protein
MTHPEKAVFAKPRAERPEPVQLLENLRREAPSEIAIASAANFLDRELARNHRVVPLP